MELDLISRGSNEEEDDDEEEEDDEDFERSYMEQYNELRDMIREGNDLLEEIQER